MIDSSSREELEDSLLLGHAWWSVAELAATEELVFPVGVDTLLRDLLADCLPSTPIRLPWRADKHD
ncbi:MAG: hypothetical protein ACRDTA_10685 [Pseudonocardiaceae bacterium]